MMICYAAHAIYDMIITRRRCMLQVTLHSVHCRFPELIVFRLMPPDYATPMPRFAADARFAAATLFFFSIFSLLRLLPAIF